MQHVRPDCSGLTIDKLLPSESVELAKEFYVRGYLAPSEHLREMIERDEKIVSELKTTCGELGRFLEILTLLVRNDPNYKICNYATINSQFIGSIPLRMKPEKQPSIETLPKWCSPCRHDEEKKHKGWLSAYPENPQASQSGWVVSSYRYVEWAKYRIAIVMYCSSELCPFQAMTQDSTFHGNEIGGADIYIQDKKTNKFFSYGTLLPHLIREHHCFEWNAKNNKYRIEPKDIIDFFGMETIIQVCETNPNIKKNALVQVDAVSSPLSKLRYGLSQLERIFDNDVITVYSGTVRIKHRNSEGRYTESRKLEKGNQTETCSTTEVIVEFKNHNLIGNKNIIHTQNEYSTQIPIRIRDPGFAQHGFGFGICRYRDLVTNASEFAVCQ